LSVGEQLVTQGSLSLFAESRKSQTATKSSSPVASPQSGMTHAQADAQGIPHSHDASGNLAQSSETASPSGGFPIGTVAAVGGGAVLLVGAIAVLGGGRKKKKSFSNKKGGF